MATTGAAWHVADADFPEPWAFFDPDARRIIPFDWSDFLADLETEYASHETIADPALTVVASSETAGVINVTVEASGTPAMVLRQYYGLTVRITCADGQIEDQTLRLRARQR